MGRHTGAENKSFHPPNTGHWHADHHQPLLGKLCEGESKENALLDEHSLCHVPCKVCEVLQVLQAMMSGVAHVLLERQRLLDGCLSPFLNQFELLAPACRWRNARNAARTPMRFRLPSAAPLRTLHTAVMTQGQVSLAYVQVIYHSAASKLRVDACTFLPKRVRVLSSSISRSSTRACAYVCIESSVCVAYMCRALAPSFEYKNAVRCEN